MLKGICLYNCLALRYLLSNYKKHILITIYTYGLGKFENWAHCKVRVKLENYVPFSIFLKII